MDYQQYKKLALKIVESQELELEYADCNWYMFLPLLEKMRSEGAVVLIKWDGERGKGDSGPYTAVVSSKALKEQFYRTDAASMEDALAYIIVNYAREMWNFAE